MGKKKINEKGYILTVLSFVAIILGLVTAATYGIIQSETRSWVNVTKNVQTEALAKSATLISSYYINQYNELFRKRIEGRVPGWVENPQNFIITKDKLDNIVNYISSILQIPQDAIILEDESAKININTMGYVLPYYLWWYGPGSAYYSYIHNYADALGITDFGYTTQWSSPPPPGDPGGWFVYPYKPEVKINWLSKEIGGTKYLSYQVLPQDIYPELEDEEEIINLPSWSDLNILNDITTSPTLGINVNTAEEKILKVFLSWYREAVDVFHVYSSVTPAKEIAPRIAMSRSRNMSFRYDVTPGIIISLRPYTSHGITQKLAEFSFAFLFHAGSRFTDTPGIDHARLGLEDYSFKYPLQISVEGPSIFVASSKYYSITLDYDMRKVKVKFSIDKSNKMYHINRWKMY
jgi:uncharacterized protein (UPF0333 family)